MNAFKEKYEGKTFVEIGQFDAKIQEISKQSLTFSENIEALNKAIQEAPTTDSLKKEV